MARFRIALALLAVMVFAAVVIAAAFYWKEYWRPQNTVNRQIAGGGTTKTNAPDIGKRHFDGAISLIKEGELISARDRLVYLLTYFPESPSAFEARRILGEINMDLLISKQPMPGKSEYIVKRGDALVSIARRSKTTIDYIMRSNGKTTALIYPDEKLVVSELDHNVLIDLKSNLLTIQKGEEFVKQYAILDTNLPPSVRSKTSTSVSEKVAWYDGRAVNFTDKNYLHCTKWIRTGKTGLFIRQHRPDVKVEEGSAKPFGVMIAGSDLEELFTVLTNGSVVR
ncbi:MAG: LysM peptidoglycan-binding domain-containing protein, partial [Verrucomicrobiota bacterium]